MVNIDTVYQRVLAIANKEQRGYITPQEFNLFANQAQVEIFEQYFYDYNQFQKIPGNDTVYADVDDMLEEKIQIFEDDDDFTDISNYVPAGANPNLKELPDYIYRVEAIYIDVNACEIVNTKDYMSCATGGPMVAPSLTRPIANIRNNRLRVAGPLTGSNTNPAVAAYPLTLPTRIIYIRRPDNVRWGYFVISEKALYNVNASANFELHQSEETELVYKILKLGGIAMQREDVMRAGQLLEQSQIQQEKK